MPNETITVGIDPSLAGTAIAVLGRDGSIRSDRLTTKPTSHHAATLTRLGLIETWLRDNLAALPADRHQVLVAIEGPAFGRSDGKSHERAGLWWRLFQRATIYTSRPILVIAPTSLKKYATGRGNTDKDAVLLAVSRRYPEFAGRSNDEADALILAAMAARYDGHAIEPWLPADQLAAMRKLCPDAEVDQ